ncbi:MAG TPA: HAD family hydrolase [Actinomycetota bacterium]|nr:HAD family hydrolase [Actinomycetota bacterium]
MPIPRPPRAVTFDCWSTLISDKNWEQTMAARQQSLIEIAGRRGVELTPERSRELIEAAWEQHVISWRAGGVFGAKGAADWILGQLGISVVSPNGESAEDELAAELALAIESATSGVGTYVLEGADEAVQIVREAGIGTALVCDTGFTPARFVRRFLDEHGIKLDHYFFSDEVGKPKPYPPIFEAALAATGSQPHEAVHIGDLKRTDIAGARNAGMGTIRYTGLHDDLWTPEDTTGAEADAVMDHWSKLPEILGL